MSSLVLGISRLFHITAGCYIIGNTFADIIWGVESSSVTYLIVYLICIALLLVSGTISIIYTRPSKIFKYSDQKIWVFLMYFKFVLWILFIPIPDWIAQSVGGSFPRTEFNTGLIFAMLLLSIAAKQFRESKQTNDSSLLR
jgi:hypothetical protein